MPANLTPEYKAAEAAYKKARDTKERLECLREMLRSMPKHKGTDHLQADIKTRIKELTEEMAGPRKGAARGGPATVVHPEGAAQVALLGPPNAGKSALHARLTGSSAESAPYLFTTQVPQPGMLSYRDIHFQLVDLPPIAPDHSPAWIAGALQPADAALLVVDLGEPACVDRVMALMEFLAEKHVTLTGDWNEKQVAEAEGEADVLRDPFAVRLPTLLVATKADQLSQLREELDVFLELTGLKLPDLAVSAVTGEGLQDIGPWLFEHLGIVRVYTKAPGRPPDRERPFTVRRGQTIDDVARLVHKDIARGLKYARLWGGAHFNGQQVGSDHPVSDGDIVELHT
jgi:ribosome-interacting GTPase 1